MWLSSDANWNSLIKLAMIMPVVLLLIPAYNSKKNKIIFVQIMKIYALLLNEKLWFYSVDKLKTETKTKN